MQSLIQTQLRRIRERGVGASAEINPFWRKLFADIDALFAANPKPSNAEIQKAMGYGWERLPDWFPSNMRPLEKRGVLAVMDGGSLAGVPKGTALHVAQLHFLRQKGLFEAYIAWADERRIASDMNMGRLWWYAERVERTLGELGRPGPQNVLELGSGSGRLALNLWERGLVRHYVMVDLPEMLLNAMISVADNAPEADMRLGEAPDFSIERPTFWFLETTDIEKVAPDSVDLALNINSMMEMDEEVRDYYIGQFYRALRPGGMMYNVNRMQRAMSRRNGEPFVSNPLLYPYRPDDVVLEWEPDECQESGRARDFFAHPSFAISRMHLKAERAEAAAAEAMPSEQGVLQRLKAKLAG